MFKLLTALWNEPRAPEAPDPLWWDWVLVALAVLVSIIDGVVSDHLFWRPFTTALCAVLAVTLLWRRTYPIQMVVIFTGALAMVQIVALFSGLDWNGLDSNVLFFVLFPYALSRWGTGREALVGVVLLGVSFMTTISVDMRSWVEALGASLVFLLPAALGAAVRYQDAAQRRSREQLRTQEREQLARELHDTVAHHVSAIAIQAQAGQALAATRPEAPLEVLAVIEEAASRTLVEMRNIVHVLRDDGDADRVPMATLADIQRLADDSTCPLQVELVLSGELDDLDPTLEATMFRLVQESLTNAVRHARKATRVTVKIAGERDQVLLSIVDDGVRVAQLPPAGLGLRGMTERVALLGGKLQANPDPTSGWVVEASIPKQSSR